jgi:hypothetical protein
VPPASHLALLNTLTIHPLHTSRTAAIDRLEVSSHSLDYLRNLLAIVGPVNANFRAAFQFHSMSRWHRRSNLYNDGTSSDEDVIGDDDSIRSKFANANSVWYRGQDFWAVVGWAFNCSALHPNRWRYWKVWLEFMTEVLEADWNERMRLDEEAHERAGHATPIRRTFLEDSILMMYITQRHGRNGGHKWILKSLFADGSNSCVSVFGEIFDKETKGLPHHRRKRKRERELEIENDKFGDYYDDESLSSGGSQPPTPQKRMTLSSSATEPDEEPVANFDDSIELRLRLFKLLSAASFYFEKRFVELPDLYETYLGIIRLLPLPQFQHFVSDHSSPLIDTSRVTILRGLLDHMLPSSAPDPAKIDPEGAEDGAITTIMLNICYLPHSANTVDIEDNIKISLLLENLLQLLWSKAVLSYSSALRDAAIQGVEARETKIKKKRGRAKLDSSIDAEPKKLLAQSGQRILSFIDVIEICHVPDEGEEEPRS